MDLHDAFSYSVSIEITRRAPYFHSCMFLMMTNVALSLQRCVPRIKLGGWREASGMERKEWGEGYGNGREGL